MPWLYRNVIRPVLFRQDSEEIHDFTLSSLAQVSESALGRHVVSGLFPTPPLPIRLWDLDFPNPLGLAAGMDKFGRALPVWECLGFGFAELGGVTWQEQPGNPQPRMFRAVAEEALVNRMGFNNPGAEKMATMLRKWKANHLWPQHPVGMNLGKSKNTPLDQAPSDYANSFSTLWDLVDFFVVNVSSPNTPNLRQLQDKSSLSEILLALNAINTEKSAKLRLPRRPVLVKVAPDLTFEALDEILDLIGPCQISGLVATNTTIARPATHDSRAQKTFLETGGLSGRPVRQRSTEIIRHIYKQTEGALPIIGVGGIFSAADAWEKISAGASLIQVYSGMVYEGPSICREIITGLAAYLEQVGLTKISEAVGISHQ